MVYGWSNDRKSCSVGSQWTYVTHCTNLRNLLDLCVEIEDIDTAREDGGQHAHDRKVCFNLACEISPRRFSVMFARAREGNGAMFVSGEHRHGKFLGSGISKHSRSAWECRCCVRARTAPVPDRRLVQGTLCGRVFHRTLHPFTQILVEQALRSYICTLAYLSMGVEMPRDPPMKRKPVERQRRRENTRTCASMGRGAPSDGNDGAKGQGARGRARVRAFTARSQRLRSAFFVPCRMYSCVRVRGVPSSIRLRLGPT